MRHRKKSEKFSRPRAQRKALIKSLLRAMVINESIKTTESKAKGIRPWVDKLVEWGKDNTLHSKRQAYKLLNNHTLVKRLCDEIAPRFANIQGGYTRIFGISTRLGDGARMSQIEFTRLPEKETTRKVKKEKKAVSREEADKPASEKPAKTGKTFGKGVKGIFKREKGSK